MSGPARVSSPSGASVTLLERVRLAAGLSQDELARRVGMSATTVPAYEHGHESPSLDAVDRRLACAGCELDVRPRIEFVKVTTRYGRYVLVPTRLPQLPAERALATVELPLSVNWSQPGRVFRMSDRGDRARVYEIVLCEGNEEEFLRYTDGALLVDLSDEVLLPRVVRAAWSPLIDQVRRAAGAGELTAERSSGGSGQALGGDQ